MKTDNKVEYAERWMRRARRDLAAIERLEVTYLSGQQAVPTDGSFAFELAAQLDSPHDSRFSRRC